MNNRFIYQCDECGATGTPLARECCDACLETFFMEATPSEGRKKITSLFFEGQQWTPRHDGGIYQAVRVWANGRLIGTVGMGYGYGRQYETFAMELLADVGLITPELSKRAPWVLERTFGVVVYSSLAHVAKRELVKANVVRENVQLFANIDASNEKLFDVSTQKLFDGVADRGE